MSEKLPPSLQYDDTTAFVGRFVPSKARILDVGCGSGGLAAALGAAGHAVTAIDASEEAAAEARAAGVNAVHADLLEFAGGPFDAVLFSFALHHIPRLPQALEKAQSLLAPEGVVMLEEFGIERVDAATASWFFGTQDVLAAAGLLRDTEPSGVLDGGDALKRWRERFDPARHGHGSKKHRHGGEKLHEGGAMREAVAARFAIRHEESTPALARFWLHRMNAASLPVARQLLPLERLLVAQGVIRAFGFRVVASAVESPRKAR